VGRRNRAPGNDSRTGRRRSPSVYAVAILPTVLFRQEIQSLEFYYSGKLATFDTLTTWLTAAAIVAGFVLCWPWVRGRYAATESPIVLMFTLVGLAVLQSLAVFIARFLFYVGSGGIL
jgi:cation transport ATPase